MLAEKQGMASRRRVRAILPFLVTLLAVHVQRASGQTDVECLLDFKASVSDPGNSLWSWSASNTSSVCFWDGIYCFKVFALPVYKIIVASFALKGSWPAGLSKCGSLQTLDLSFNSFSGPIPSTICSDIPNLVSLNLQHNDIGGVIPSTFGSCMFLNDIYLNDNQLSGQIPAQLALPPRLVGMSVADNQLSGVIPNTFDDNGKPRFSASSFTGNKYLCGAPLTDQCISQPVPAGKSTDLGPIIGGIVGGVVGLLLLFGVLFYCFVKRSRSMEKAKVIKGASRLPKEGRWARKIRQPTTIVVAMFNDPVGRIMFTDLMVATNDFSESTVISTSATGTVYKATFADGTAKAIKRLKVSSQDDRAFQAEMETLGNLRPHRNIAPLLGFCVAAGERLLVYDYIPNGTVRDHLQPQNAPPLPWPERVRIATGAARGLAWMHHNCNPRVLHRNISSQSILLDSDNEPRITDFGLARLMDNTDTHLSTFFNGDYGNAGYVAPEYVRRLTFSTKNDIYSFGVVLLELLTGQMPVKVVPANSSSFEGNLVEWVNSLAESGNVIDAVDPALKGSEVDDEEILRILKVAISCVSAEPKERPSMFEVYQLLRAIGLKYNYTASFEELPDMEIWRKDDDDGVPMKLAQSESDNVTIDVVT